MAPHRTAWTPLALGLALLATVPACGKASDPIISHLYRAAASSFEVPGEEEATRLNRKGMEEGDISFMAMFWPEKIRLWRGQDYMEGNWKLVEGSTKDRIEVSIEMPQEGYGSGKAVFDATQDSFDMTLEMPVFMAVEGQFTGEVLDYKGQKIRTRGAGDMQFQKHEASLHFEMEKRAEG